MNNVEPIIYLLIAAAIIAPLVVFFVMAHNIAELKKAVRTSNEILDQVRIEIMKLGKN